MKMLSVVLENLHLLGNIIKPVGLIDKVNVFCSFCFLSEEFDLLQHNMKKNCLTRQNLT